MNKESLKGLLVGLMAPIAAFVVYVAFFTVDSNPKEMYFKIIDMDKLSQVISLSVLINLVIFFINIKTYRDEQARWIIFSTIIYGIVIVILKLS